MLLITPHIPLFFSIILFVSAVLLHLVKKNSSAVYLYVLQSSAVSVLLALSFIEHFYVTALIALLATIAAKMIFAPYFLGRFIRENQLRFLESVYLTTSVTLLVLALFVALAFSRFFAPLALLSTSSPTLVMLSIATLLTSIFLLVNRKDAISQTLGVLSIENSIVAFAVVANLEPNPALQLGITFNIFVWVTIAMIFLRMIYTQFGSLDITSMKNVSEITQ